jgi:CheY-like chemotaxis protein
MSSLKKIKTNESPYQRFSGERKLNILLVDDNRGDEILVRVALKETDLGTNLETVQNGADAMACLRHELKYIDSARPDVVILDLHLTGQTGQELLCEIRAEAALANIPILMWTSLESNIQKAACDESNVTAYIVKPWDLETYLSIIKATERYWLALVSSSNRESFLRSLLRA